MEISIKRLQTHRHQPVLSFESASFQIKNVIGRDAKLSVSKAIAREN